MIKIIIDGEEVKASQGASTLDKITYDLDEGQFSIRYTEREDPYPMYSVVDFRNAETNAIVKSMRLSYDNVQLVSKNPKLFTHNIGVIEHTKMLELFWIEGKRFLQPIGDDYPEYSLLDVTQQLLDTTPLLLVGQSNANFGIPPALSAILDSVKSPEFTFKDQNLREALNDVFSVIDAKPRLNRFGQLQIDFFNELGEEITEIRTTKLDREQDINEYATNLISSTINPVPSKNIADFDGGNVIFPSDNDYISLRSQNYIYDDLQSFIPTPTRIYDIKHVYIIPEFIVRARIGAAPPEFQYFAYLNYVESGRESASYEEYKVDCTSRVVERQKYNTLYTPRGGVASSQDPRNFDKSNTVVYDYGRRNIDVSETYGLWEINTALRGLLATSMIKSVAGETITFYDEVNDEYIDIDIPEEWYTDGEGLLFSWPYTQEENITLEIVPQFSLSDAHDAVFCQVHYKTIPESARFEVTREDTSEIMKYSEMLTNQKNRIVDSTSYMNNMYFTINKKGLSNMEISHVVKNIEDAFNIGDYIDKFIVTEKETIFYNDHIRCLYKLNKNFNKTSLFTGLNAQVRQWEVGERDRTIERHVSYKEYIKVSNDTNGSSVTHSQETMSTSYFHQNILAHFDGVFAEPVGTFLYGFPSFVSSPAIKSVGGKTLTFTIDMGDNVASHIPQIEERTSWSISQFANRLVPYADEFARFENMELFIYGKNKTLDFDPDDYPRITTPSNPIGTPNFKIHKDGGEHLRFNLAYQFYTIDDDITVGNNFVENCGLSVTEPKSLQFFTSSKPIRKEQQYVEGVLQEQTLNVDFPDLQDTSKTMFEILNTPAGEYKSWGIKSGDDIWFASNGEFKRFIKFEFQNKREGIEYEYFES